MAAFHHAASSVDSRDTTDDLTDIRETRVSNLADAASAFLGLNDKVYSCVVRGRDDGEKFVDAPNRLLILHVKGYQAVATDAELAVREFIDAQLPACFQEAQFFWRLDPKSLRKASLSAYVGFWLDKPRTLAQMRRWAGSLPCSLLIAKDSFSPSAPIFTADPIFESGSGEAIPAGYYKDGIESITLASVDGENDQGFDTITILETLGPVLTKTFKADNTTESYGEAANFKIREKKARNLHDLAEILKPLHDNPKRSVIRGKFVGKERAAKGPYENAYPRINSNFPDQSIHWFMIDIDGYRPEMIDPVTETEDAVKLFITEILPACFRDVSFYWHLSSSAGMPGKEEILKCHLWLWLKTPYTCAQLYEWAKVIGSMIDKAVYRIAQIHYTANPIFEEGRIDPVPQRSGFYQGASDEVDLVIDAGLLALAREQGAGEGGNDMKLVDPSEKDGLIGLFHRTYSAEQVLLEILDGEFEQVTDRRYTWHNGGGTPEGVWVHDDGLHVGSSHNTWPISGIANLWDLVRVFKFADLDQSADAFEQMDLESRGIGGLPSNQAMIAFAEGLPEIVAALAKESAAQQSAVTVLLEKITAAKTVQELIGPIAKEAMELLAEHHDEISKARINSAIQARGKKLDGANLPISVVRALTQPAHAAKKGGMVVGAGDQLSMAKALKNAVFRNSRRERVAIRANESWYLFNDRYYAELRSDEKINNAAWQFLPNLSCHSEDGKVFPLCPNKSLVAGVVDALRSELATDTELPPAWLPGCDGPDPANLLVMSNGILNIATGEMLEHTPRLFAVNALPYNYDHTAKCPVWLAFLDQVLPGDTESHQLLQEWFGYCLTADTTQQKFLMLIGQKRSGKGTVGRALQNMLGGNINSIGPTLASLIETAGLEDWIGKLVAVFGDTRSGGRETQTVVERILSIVGEDTIRIKRLYRTAVSMRLPTRITILSNEMLRLGDASGALIGRMLVLDFGQTFWGREDTTLEAKLNSELPGILNWAIEGKRRLTERGKFVQPASGKDLLQESHDINSPIAVFVREHCELDPFLDVKLDDLFEAWQIHCRDENHHSGDKAQFSKNLRAAFPEIKKVRPRDEATGKQYNACRGVSLNAEMLDRLHPFS